MLPMGRRVGRLARRGVHALLASFPCELSWRAILASYPRGLVLVTQLRVILNRAAPGAGRLALAFDEALEALHVALHAPIQEA